MKSLYGYRFRYSFFFKLIIPEIQHLRQHNGQKKCTIGDKIKNQGLRLSFFSFLFDVYVLPRSDELTRRTSVQTMFPYHNVRSLNQLI
jgi:hypothetical protein